MEVHNKVSLAQLKAMSHDINGSPAHAKKNYQVQPMFLPSDISAKKGKGVINVVPRQNFMYENIQHWVLFNTYRGASVALAVLAVIAFSINIYLSALLGIAAGWAYGKFKFKDFIINHQLRERWLLEGT